jgi:glyoxylase-like metal-dependent hydrolase (beta-lactamase superfamily II)
MGTVSSSNNLSAQSVPEISPQELVRALEAQEPLQFVDVRAHAGSGAGSPGFIPADRVLNIVGSNLVRTPDLTSTGIDPALPVIVFCAHGNDSKFVAYHLNRLGADARSLAGGMAEWMMLSVPRMLPPPATLDYLMQFDRVGKGALSYVLISSGEAIIIDPPRDTRAHLQFIGEKQAKLVAVADTHVHADFISGGAALARQWEVPYYLHPADSVYPYDNSPGRIDFEPVSEGSTIRIGRSSICARHTPGHSPGSVSYTLGEDAGFTGDFLFISSVGRPDLADKTAEWSALLWKSIQAVKSEWAANIMIYPGHYTSDTARRTNGSIGERFQNLYHVNPFLRMTKEEFLKGITQKPLAVPEAYRILKAVNVGLVAVGEREAEVLEFGKNECAVG